MKLCGRVSLLAAIFVLCGQPVLGAAAKPVFPLKASENRRYLVDSAGKPFFYHADTPWMLLLALNSAEAEEYLRDRKAKGFTALQIMLTGFLNSKNRAGQLPFHGDHDVSRPNEAFFAHADAIIRKATEMGFLLAIAPMWSGCCGEGWANHHPQAGKPLGPLNVAGPEKARAWGRWVGDRYAGFKNIIWIMGGDRDPDISFNEICALAEGIREKAPHQLMTVHNGAQPSARYYNEAVWLDLNAAYTYQEVQGQIFEEWRQRKPVRPIFLSESGYEHEKNDGRYGTPFRLRRQAYGSVLSGALMGHAYGHRDIWRFNQDWRKSLNDTGIRQMAQVLGFFTTRAWWKLEPDQGEGIVTQGRGTLGQDDYVSAGLATDGSFLLIYIPVARPIHVDLSRLSGNSKARWFDPTNGHYQSVQDAPFANAGTHEFTPPAPNAGGDTDWVLVLESSKSK
jgi:hypothetical protein